LTADPVYEFEKSRDTAVRYNRNVWIDTVQAMERIDKIRTDREARFWERRMKNSEHNKKEMIKSNLIKNETLVADPEIREKIEKLKEEKEEKQKLKKMRNQNLNLGLDENMDMDDYQQKEKTEKHKENVKFSKKKKRRIARKQKLLNLNRNIKIPKKGTLKPQNDEVDMDDD